MNINVIAQRDDGASPGFDIIDPLITSENVALERGTQYIDAKQKNRVAIRTNGPMRSWVAPCDLAEIIDSQAESYKALIVSVSFKITKANDDFKADIDLTMDKIHE